MRVAQLTDVIVRETRRKRGFRKLVGLSNPEFYYRLISVFLVIVGCKLIYDGVSGL